MDKVFDSILSWEGGKLGGDKKKYLLSPKNVGEFFSERKQIIRIPEYQRPYSWSKKNILDLLKDILILSKKGDDSSWFLGPIFVVLPSENSNYLDLLDGQQRTTTIQILLREASLIINEDDGIDITLNKKLKNAIQKAEQCLQRTVTDFQMIPVFETEPELLEVFKKYILEFGELDNHIELKQKRKDFEHDLKQIKEEGTFSAGTFLEAIQTIRKFIRDHFIDNDNDVPTNLDAFFDFLNAVINKCWLIEIPLQNHSDSIQIFESINNRGKPLNIVDKLRYKCIVNTTEDNVNFIRTKWKEIYSGLIFLVEKKYLKNEDDFFKIFLNSIKGSNKTKEDELIEIFEENFLDNNQTILNFLDEVLKIIGFYEILHSSIDSENKFIELFKDSREKNKVKGILRLLTKAISVSDNSRFMLFHVVSKYPPKENTKYILIISIWNIIRTVFHVELYKNTKSNDVRTDYMKKIKESSKGDFQFAVNVTDGFNFKKNLHNILKTKSNKEEEFILYFFAYLSDYEILSCYSPLQYSHTHVEHLFPLKWTKWIDKKYTTEEVLRYIDELPDDSEYFKYFKKELLIDEITSSDNFELPSLESNARPKREEDRLIEYIGNKWVFHASQNIAASNHDFKTKLDYYNDEKFIKIPANRKQAGISQYEEFSYKEIILRTLTIINFIVDRFNSNWDNV